MIKIQGQELSLMLDGLAEMPGTDKRWLGIAKTDLQKGIMAAVRSVAKPEGF